MTTYVTVLNNFKISKPAKTSYTLERDTNVLRDSSVTRDTNFLISKGVPIFLCYKNVHVVTKGQICN